MSTDLEPRISLVEKVDNIVVMTNSEWAAGQCPRHVRDAVAGLANMALRFYDQREFYRAEAAKTMAHRDERILTTIAQNHEVVLKEATLQTSVLQQVFGAVSDLVTVLKPTKLVAAARSRPRKK